MNNVLYKKNCNRGALQIHIESPLILFIKIKNDTKLDKYCVKIKFIRDNTAERLDIYEFKMSLFDNRYPE